MRQQLAAPLALALASFAGAGCAAGPSVTGSFDRTLTVTAPIRLELANASGDVSITGSGDNQVHVHAQVRSSGMGFDNPQKRLDDVVNNPPIEQRGDTIRIGKDLSAHTQRFDLLRHRGSARHGGRYVGRFRLADHRQRARPGESQFRVRIDPSGPY